MSPNDWLERSIELAMTGVKRGDGGPFGALIVRGDELISEAWNEVLLSNDPTAHAEVVAIRRACKKLGSFQLDACSLYTSCEPCPMCLGAIYWARPQEVIFGATKEIAAEAEFDDQFIYDEILIGLNDRKIPFTRIASLDDLSRRPFKLWKEKADKQLY